MATSAASSGASSDSPVQPLLSAPFWEGLERAVLVLQRCDDCGTWRWTPQLCCPRCLSESYTWTPTVGLGVLYSYTRVERSPDPARFPAPYVLAVVALDEGPHMLTTLVDCRFEEVEIGMRVVVRFQRARDGTMVYPFAPHRAAP